METSPCKINVTTPLPKFKANSAVPRLWCWTYCCRRLKSAASVMSLDTHFEIVSSIRWLWCGCLSLKFFQPITVASRPSLASTHGVSLEGLLESVVKPLPIARHAANFPNNSLNDCWRGLQNDVTKRRTE